MFVDSHAHLDDKAFDFDREQMIARAHEAGVRTILAIGGGSAPDELASSVPFAEQHDWIYAAVGIHPHEAARAEERHFDLLRITARGPKILAIGEIGLDFHYDYSPRETQRAVFRRELEMARELKLPVVIHCREAWGELREIVRAEWKTSGLGGILHCFSGTAEDAHAFLDWGFMISFAGNITFKNAEPLRAAARDVPLDRLLTETDSPYLAPVPHRGKRNEPAYVREVAAALAAVRGMGAEELGAAVVENFKRFFRLA